MNKNDARSRPLTGLAGLGSLVSLVISSALGADEPRLEEVIVTASKRETNLMQTPISITAFTQEFLDREGVRSAPDLAGTTTFAKVEAAVANYAGRQARGMLNLPVSDTFALRAVFMVDMHEGMLHQDVDRTDVEYLANGIAFDGIPDVDQRRTAASIPTIGSPIKAQATSISSTVSRPRAP